MNLTKRAPVELIAKKIVLSALTMYGVYLALLYFMQQKIIYPTYAIPNAETFPIPADVQQYFLENQDGTRVEYWFMPSSEGPNAPTIVLFHGNAELIDFIYHSHKHLRSWGFNLLFPEYRGYGRSSGQPTQKDIIQDLQTMVAKLSKEKLIQADNLIFMGTSLGGGIAFDLARSANPKAILVRSTFYSIGDMVKGYYAPSFLVRDKYFSNEVAREFPGPIFIAHGTKDSIIPFHHGERLHEVSRNSVFYKVDSDHNDFPLDGAYWNAVRKFLADVGLLEKSNH